MIFINKYEYFIKHTEVKENAIISFMNIEFKQSMRKKSSKMDFLKLHLLFESLPITRQKGIVQNESNYFMYLNRIFCIIILQT